ncbi:hypothetical protein CONPUDRAFT_162568 [Coniophora puteana RWD-64-598 SS2]|uniref:Translation machinery associated TMA7 n=1 Tax=Coniophora puteana (strain RWD-64-598) TaxID=741705 RepID=A0A5M3N1U4_CONPW|nr:uncharacterized protein CONPUDRAFT_162568 [Coniophora puteana RWD-64-598 SS2]EIW85360.1 hypothetical protein CONPUDRAFT_162568 [Coniophora puteana RWD-64-598 SS2]
MSRQGGKLKPLKAPKKDKKEDDEDEKAFKERKKAEEAALKAAKDKALKGECSLLSLPSRLTLCRWCTWGWNQEIRQEISHVDMVPCYTSGICARRYHPDARLPCGLGT